jgi:hypothetical protein
MKKVLFMAFALSVLSVGAMAQAKTPYAGTWNLDATKSKFDGPMRVDTSTLTVTQTAKDITVKTETKRPAPPADAPAGPPPGLAGAPGGSMPGGGMGRGGRFSSFGDGTATYTLDGKETKVEVDGGPMGKVPVTYKGAKEADGSLNLSAAQTMMGPNGEMTISRKETWSLSADGTMLTVSREQTSPRGTNTSTLVFVKG